MSRAKRLALPRRLLLAQVSDPSQRRRLIDAAIIDQAMASHLDAVAGAPETSAAHAGLALPQLPVERSATTCPDRIAESAALRVLHVVNGEHYSGAERVQDLLAEYLPTFGFVVDFVCLKPDRFPQARNYREARLFELPMRRRFDLNAAQELTQLIRNQQYALVHAHTPRSVLVGAIASKRADVPLAYHVHSPAGRDSTRLLINKVNLWLERFSVRRAARVIAVAPSVQDYMIKLGLPREQVICVPNGVPVIEARPRANRPQRWTLGMAALFRPRKGLEVLLESLAAVRSDGLEVRLRAIGPFETEAYESEIRRFAAQLQLEDAVDWTGFVSDMPAELASIDALVLPSLFGEGLPMVVLEAMAAGLPVIASRVEGVPQAIRHRREGLLVEPGSVSQLARAIEELVQGQVEYPAMSRSAQRRHADHFSANVMARNVAAAYEAILRS